MEPREACAKASQLALAGNLQGAIDLLDPVLDEFREFGPAYTLHARVFLMAGDTAQPLTDLDAAEWANREYGTNHDLIEVQKDDFIYMAPYCPQFFYATGWEKSAYLLYKDVNRDYAGDL